MISLAGRDILHGWAKYVFTGLGLGLLIGVTLTMAGVSRGMVDDAHALLANSRADLWVVQKDTQGPYAESSSIKDDVVRSVRGMPGVAVAAITRRPHGYVVALVEGAVKPTVNGTTLTTEAVNLQNGDLIELAGTQMQFVQS